MSKDDQQLHPLIASFLSEISKPETQSRQNADHPSYWTSNPASLLTTSNVHSVSLGTGNRIFETLLPTIESAQDEVLFVTCYWAQSDSLNRIGDSLRKLSARNLATSPNKRIRVRICFSSSGVWQKLSHPQSRQGRLYSPAEWSKTLGLPNPDELQGIDLQVKSVFFLPISIIHPKFVVVDRKLAFLPSCNVSWEEWLEGCVELSGQVVRAFVRFWEAFWADGEDRGPGSGIAAGLGETITTTIPSSSAPSPALLTHLPFPNNIQTQETTTLFIPSPHHRNPDFRPIPFQSPPLPPPTPLNTFLLLAFSQAKCKITIQTPNLTSQPAMEGLLAALGRGVEVSITTSENLQRMEQVVTAGTTTGRCIEHMVAKHKLMVEERKKRGQDVEEAHLPVGKLSVAYYTPHPRSESQPQEMRLPDEPVQSHFKLTLIDDDAAVFGSGNLDRASWFTSQELGVAFFGREVVGRVGEGLKGVMGGRNGRRRVVYEG